jgi:hypothetical protein
MMTYDEILAEFRAADALLEGHFILSSGLRSPRYLQCARVLMDPARAERLARALADKLPAEVRQRIDVVLSPAMGGIIIGHEMGRALGRPAMFLERPQGVFELKYFFHSGISSSFGESVSSVTIKQRIRKIIENEDPRKPLSDSKIVRRGTCQTSLS